MILLFAIAAVAAAALFGLGFVDALWTDHARRVS